MIDRLVNFFFGCRHRTLSRPLGALSNAGVPEGGAYVVCLDCGKHFAYDTREMKMGKEIPASK
jgi:hypothetical protein